MCGMSLSIAIPRVWILYMVTTVMIPPTTVTFDALASHMVFHKLTLVLSLSVWRLAANLIIELPYVVVGRADDE